MLYDNVISELIKKGQWFEIESQYEKINNKLAAFHSLSLIHNASPLIWKVPANMDIKLSSNASPASN